MDRSTASTIYSLHHLDWYNLIASLLVLAAAVDIIYSIIQRTIVFKPSSAYEAQLPSDAGLDLEPWRSLPLSHQHGYQGTSDVHTDQITIAVLPEPPDTHLSPGLAQA